MVWGTFLEKNLPSSNRHLVDFGKGLSDGGGVQSLFGQCPNRGGTIFKGASLTHSFSYAV